MTGKEIYLPQFQRLRLAVSVKADTNGKPKFYVARIIRGRMSRAYASVTLAL
jgi:hypothetical protein